MQVENESQPTDKVVVIFVLGKDLMILLFYGDLVFFSTTRNSLNRPSKNELYLCPHLAISE